MDRLLSVAIEGQNAHSPIAPGRVRELVERFRRDGIEPHVRVDAKHGNSKVCFIHPPQGAGISRPLDQWESAAAALWHEHHLNSVPLDVDKLLAFLVRLQSML